MKTKIGILFLIGIITIQQLQAQTISISNLKREVNGIISNNPINQNIQDIGSDSFFLKEFDFPDFDFDNQFPFDGEGLGSNFLNGSNCQFPRKQIKGKCSCDNGAVFIQNRCLPLQKGGEQDKNFHKKFKQLQRAIDGSGNNKEHFDWGSANSAMKRLTFPSYTDRISIPPNNRPNPRLISNFVGKLVGTVSESKLRLTNMFTIWGQFLDHDVTLVPAQKGSGAQDMAISVPKGDPDFDPNSTGDKKLLFSRSIFKDRSSPREQINVVTAWLDGSQIYGSDEVTSNKLRAFQNGLLKTSPGNLMPKESSGLFLVGDIRANQNMILASLHTIFVRQHNRIAKAIRDSNSRLQDQEIYQLSRILVIAQLSKITFEDWLPALIGPQLYQSRIGKYKSYNPKENPNIISQFATAAFRIGHPLLVDEFPLIDKTGKTVRKIELPKMFFNSQQIQIQQTMDNLFRGVTRSANKQRSCQVVNSIRNLLITDSQKRNIMSDLYSLNIQRGRDHGVQDYNTIRELLGYGRIKNFNQLGNDIYSSQQLSKSYSSVNDLDLFVGIVCQAGQANAVLGKVGASLVADQFRKIRDGDRFWYERILSKQTIKKIKRTTLGDIIKRNTNVRDLQKDVFKMR